jgi:hypothetical protein
VDGSPDRIRTGATALRGTHRSPTHWRADLQLRRQPITPRRGHGHASGTTHRRWSGRAEEARTLDLLHAINEQPLPLHHSSTPTRTPAQFRVRMGSRRPGACHGIARHRCWRIAGRSGPIRVRHHDSRSASGGASRTLGCSAVLRLFRVERRANGEASSTCPLPGVSMLTVAIVRVLAVLGGPIVEREVGMTSDDWFDALY